MKRFNSLACIGEFMLEIAFAPEISGGAQVSVAGDTYNTAVYAKRAAGGALRVAYVTALGTDTVSDHMIVAATRENIETKMILRRKERNPGLYALINNASGERSFLYWRNASAARTLFQAGDESLIDALRAQGAWYYSAISLAILATDQRQRFLDAAAAHRRAGGIIIFDSNYRPALWDSAAEAQEWIAKAWTICDVALPSADDERLLFGDANEEALLARLSSYGVAFGALKRGASGPLAIGWRDEGDAYPAAANVTDTSAAGDSFNGAFIAALAKGAAPADAARAGHRMASAVIGCKGAIIPKESTPSIL